MPEPEKRGKYIRTEEMRKKHGERMKAYWASRGKGKGAYVFRIEPGVKL